MMEVPKNFADVGSARAIAHDLYPSAKNISMIEHSADNIVALVDTDYAVRFPRNKNAYLRGRYEKHVLKQLEHAHTLAIPRILSEHVSPPYMVTSFVQGNHIGSATVRTLPEGQQQVFAKAVATFAYTMHTSFTLDEELQLRKELGLDELELEEPWPVYFERVVQNGHFSNPTQEEIAKRCYADWVAVCDIPPVVVVHDDLHTENMMFEDNRLVGILDFGDANVGTPEQELRQLYRISEEIMLVAVEEYQQLSGRQLNIEAIKLWCFMKELADYSTRLAAKRTSHHSFKRASHNLNAWLPEGEWGKDYDLSSIESHQ